MQTSPQTNEYLRTKHKMPAKNSFHKHLTNRQNTIYSSLSCEYKSIKFWIISSHATVMHLSFSDESHCKALEKINQLIPEAGLSRLNDETTYVKGVVQRIFDSRYEQPAPDFKNNPFLKNGTPFQQKVWQIISRIQTGETITYGKLATAAGSPGGARAAGHACNQNPLALIIPCHRVVASTGPGGFAGDMSIKLKLLEIEKKSDEPSDIKLSDIECSTFSP